jgi:hypothetical protein
MSCSTTRDGLSTPYNRKTLPPKRGGFNSTLIFRANIPIIHGALRIKPKEQNIGHLEIPVMRRSRESGNPEKSRRWIPAYAGMTGFSRFPIM